MSENSKELSEQNGKNDLQDVVEEVDIDSLMQIMENIDQEMPQKR